MTTRNLPFDARNADQLKRGNESIGRRVENHSKAVHAQACAAVEHGQGASMDFTYVNGLLGVLRKPDRDAVIAWLVAFFPLKVVSGAIKADKANNRHKDADAWQYADAFKTPWDEFKPERKPRADTTLDKLHDKLKNIADPEKKGHDEFAEGFMRELMASRDFVQLYARWQRIAQADPEEREAMIHNEAATRILEDEAA